MKLTLELTIDVSPDVPGRKDGISSDKRRKIHRAVARHVNKCLSHYMTSHVGDRHQTKIHSFRTET